MLRNPDIGQLKVERYTEQERTAARDRCVSKYGVGILLALHCIVEVKLIISTAANYQQF